MDKQDLVRSLLDKFYPILNDLKINFNELKTKITKLESDLSRNVNPKLSDSPFNNKRKCFINEQYSRKERLQISGILPSVNDNELECKVLKTLGQIDTPVDPSLEQYYHHLCSKGHSMKVIKKLSYPEDHKKVLLNTTKLKDINLKSANLAPGTKIYISENLCLHCKIIWRKCKKLWDSKQIWSFWVRNGLIRINSKNKAVSISVHQAVSKEYHFANLFPGIPLIDYYY